MDSGGGSSSGRSTAPGTAHELRASLARCSNESRDSTSRRRSPSEPQSRSSVTARSCSGCSRTALRIDLISLHRAAVTLCPSLQSGAFNFFEQPEFRRSPFTFHGGRRNSHHFRGFLDRESAEIAELDDAALLRIEFGELLKSTVQLQDIHPRIGKHAQRILEPDRLAKALAFGGLIGASMIDQDAAHHAGGNAQEMSAVLPVDRVLIDQPKIGFMDQSGRL